MKSTYWSVGVAGLIAVSTACATASGFNAIESYGPNPTLPAPDTSLIPTVKVATAIGWGEHGRPTPMIGTQVAPFAAGLDHPRWLHVLPNGDVLVAETNAPPRPDDAKGIKGWFFKRYQKKAGGAVPSANRVTLLRDADGDGIAEVRTAFLSGLNSPFGMALIDGTLYIANTDAVVKVPYVAGATVITATPQKVADLPGGTLNHHWTKGLIASPDGAKLYAAVGSNSNIAENGIHQEEGRAAIWEIDVASGAARIFATGLRNPVGMAWEPTTRTLWTTVNERDELGNDLVPDYMTSVRDGGFYGWPYSYYGQHVDERVEPARPDLVAKAIAPDYALGAHTASLGLAFSSSNGLPASVQHGMFIGQHGSWNRYPRAGYRVIFVPFTDGKPNGLPIEVLTGFLGDNGDAMGRPVGVALDQRGALLVADDTGNVVWRVTGIQAMTRQQQSTPR
ncbi:MAG TPA: sorbosone dehydrogenase family protein [Vicinamibacterales bacterium]|nr:sorbosone dehydrogenase family protein [Vicinamibacterales bacterium]